jgi:hypothetical protein
MGARVLPESARAVIDEQKVSGYLLKQDHPGNGGKAAFFLSLGYGPGDSGNLRVALLNVAALGLVVRQIASAYGQKFVVDGWLRPKSSGSPRFVTAYPSVRVIH